MLQQHEKRDYEAGRIGRDALQHWTPGQTIKNRIRIESGNGVGKTQLIAWICLHFISVFSPAISYTFAPSALQLKVLLWDKIRTDFSGHGLPGRVLRRDPEWYINPGHFALGLATDDSNSSGMERIQGQHPPYFLILMDEAEGVKDFVYDAIDRLTTGGIVIVIMIANPRTRNSRFHREAERSYVDNFRISCLDFPNVVEGREIIPGGVTRDWINSKLEANCTAVDAHSPDKFTFEVDWRPGIIYLPDSECLTSVHGIAPQETSDWTFVPVGRYEAATKRPAMEEPPDFAAIGVDVARGGSDFGTIYSRHAGVVRREKQLYHLDTLVYYQAVKELAQSLHKRGAKTVSIRIDGTGGWGSGPIDMLRKDTELNDLFTTRDTFGRVVTVNFKVHEVQFGGSPSDNSSYADLVTEMYFEAGEALRGLRLDNPPIELEADLTEREFGLVHRSGRTVKKLEDKEIYRKRRKRSPDDGDGLVLTVAPEHIFKSKAPKVGGRFIPTTRGR